MQQLKPTVCVCSCTVSEGFALGYIKLYFGSETNCTNLLWKITSYYYFELNTYLFFQSLLTVFILSVVTSVMVGAIPFKKESDWHAKCSAVAKPLVAILMSEFIALISDSIPNIHTVIEIKITLLQGVCYHVLWIVCFVDFWKKIHVPNESKSFSPRMYPVMTRDNCAPDVGGLIIKENMAMLRDDVALAVKIFFEFVDEVRFLYVHQDFQWGGEFCCETAMHINSADHNLFFNILKKGIPITLENVQCKWSVKTLCGICINFRTILCWAQFCRHPASPRSVPNQHIFQRACVRWSNDLLFPYLHCVRGQTQTIHFNNNSHMNHS